MCRLNLDHCLKPFKLTYNLTNLIGGFMKTYQIIISKHAVYEIQADNDSEAQDIAWGRFDPSDYSDDLIAEVLEVDQLPLGV